MLPLSIPVSLARFVYLSVRPIHLYMLRFRVCPASTGHALVSRSLAPPKLDPYPTLTNSIPQFITLITLCRRLLPRMNLYDTIPDKCPFDLHHHYYYRRHRHRHHTVI